MSPAQRGDLGAKQELSGSVQTHRCWLKPRSSNSENPVSTQGPKLSAAPACVFTERKSSDPQTANNSLFQKHEQLRRFPRPALTLALRVRGPHPSAGPKSLLTNEPKNQSSRCAQHHTAARPNSLTPRLHPRPKRRAPTRRTDRSLAGASRAKGQRRRQESGRNAPGSSASPSLGLPPRPSPPAGVPDPQRPAATCPGRPFPGPQRPEPPYLSRRCGPGAGGPCWSTTTGRSGSGRGGSGPRAACAGPSPAAGRAPGARGPRPLPARRARPGAPRSVCPPRPSASGGGRPGARGGAGAEGCAAGRGDPEAAPRAGSLDAGRREARGAGGRRKRTEKFAQEGAAYSRLSLRRAKAAGLRAGPPSVPANLPGCSSPQPKRCPLLEDGRGIPSVPRAGHPASRP